MHLSFTITSIGIIILVALFLLIYSFYRKAVAKQAMLALQQEEYSKILSTTTFLSLSLVVFLSLAIMLVYYDYSSSAFKHSNSCAVETGETSYGLKTCINSFGNIIYKDSDEALTKISNDLGVDANYHKVFASIWDHSTMSEDLPLLKNSFIFHTNIITTNQSFYVVDDTYDIKILETSRGRFKVSITNISNNSAPISPYYPVSLFLNNALSTPTNAEDLYITLLPEETVILEYHVDSTSDLYQYTIRIQDKNHTYERKSHS